MTPFCQSIPNHYSVSELLLKLQTMTGLVYLKDQEHPVIAFNPNAYVVYEQNQFKYFRRVGQRYEPALYTSLIDFVELTSSQASQLSQGFHGGYIGFVSYDYAAAQSLAVSERAQPALYIGRYQFFLKYVDGQWHFYSHDPDAATQYSELIQQLATQTQSEPFLLTQPMQGRWSKADYRFAFEQVQQYILAGDCYQINLTQEFVAPCQGRLITQAEPLWELTQAPYAGYLSIDHFELLSCSPELFIEFDQGKLTTRPIKGTMPRFADPLQDIESKQKLQESEKDQAENLMIVDLLRNDLSLYAQTGSVKTTRLFEIESFNQVHHMVSEIEAQLKADIHPLDMLLSALPGGSITGAPKIRAMQIIEELESGPRGAYCGSLGYFNFDGSGRFNILIRSIQKFNQEISIWAGGGITAASLCASEYQECFDKVAAMLDLLNTWQTTELNLNQ